MIMEEDAGHGSEPVVGKPLAMRKEAGPTTRGKGIEVDLLPRKEADADVATAVLPSSSIKDSQEFKKISESILRLSQGRDRENQAPTEEVAPVLAGSNFIYMQNYANEPHGRPAPAGTRFVSSPTSGARMGYLSAGGQRSPLPGNDDTQNAT